MAPVGACAVMASARLLALGAHLVLRHRAIGVAVKPLNEPGERLGELFARHHRVAVVIEPLEGIDHALVHGVEPKRLILLEGQSSVAVRVEFCQAVVSELINLRLLEAAVAIDVEGFEHRGAAGMGPG